MQEYRHSRQATTASFSNLATWKKRYTLPVLSAMIRSRASTGICRARKFHRWHLCPAGCLVPQRDGCRQGDRLQLPGVPCGGMNAGDEARYLLIQAFIPIQAKIKKGWQLVQRGGPVPSGENDGSSGEDLSITVSQHSLQCNAPVQVCQGRRLLLAGDTTMEIRPFFRLPVMFI